MSGLLILLLFALLLGLLAGLIDDRTVREERDYAQQIDHLLPQTQCGQCDYDGCAPYAFAIMKGEAGINQCPPGGTQTIRELSRLLGQEFRPLDPAHGSYSPPKTAFIDENTCIGCVKCIRACPVDAIVGAAKQMHTVIPELCTGCELCVAPCPVDCISMLNTGREPVHKSVEYFIPDER